MALRRQTSPSHRLSRSSTSAEQERSRARKSRRLSSPIHNPPCVCLKQPPADGSSLTLTPAVRSRNQRTATRPCAAWNAGPWAAQVGREPRSSQPVDANSLGWRLEEDTSPQLQVLVDASLDRVADIVRQRHHEVLVFGGLEREVSDLHRRMELDPPLARQRDDAERAQ